MYVVDPICIQIMIYYQYIHPPIYSLLFPE